MPETYATVAEYRPLYALMDAIKALVPWTWMQETDIFGVQNPETDELGFVSPMGMAGEHYAVAVYRGAKGLYGFLGLSQQPPAQIVESLFQIPQFQASFENRELLEKVDRDRIKELGLKYRGQNAWPLLRSFHPGYYPWRLESAEARFLHYALEQVLEVAPRFKAQPTLLRPKGKNRYFVRTAERQGDRLVWQDTVQEVPPPVPTNLRLSMDPQLLAAVQQLPKARLTLEMDFSMMPTPIRERDQRPYFPYMLMVVDAQSGMILAGDLLHPDPSLEAMWGEIPLKIVQLCAGLRAIPAEIRARSPLLHQLLQTIQPELNFKLKQSNRLPALDSAQNEMTQFFRQ